MSKIHISNADGQSSQHDEDEVHSMLKQGLLQDDALFWKEGMSEWQPLRDFLPPTAKVSPPPFPQESSVFRYSFARNPFGLTKVLKVMMWVQLGVAVVGLLSDFGQLSLASSGEITQEAADANDLRQGLIGLLVLGVYIATAVVFLMWVYRANLNCRGFGPVGMRFTSGWSVGYYFIPFLNLVRPYQVMKEIWKVSSDPRDWQSQRGSDILGWWWALWIISGVLSQITFRMSMRVDDVSSLQAATTASIISTAVEFPLILVAMKMISRIIEKQSELTQSNG